MKPAEHSIAWGRRLLAPGRVAPRTSSVLLAGAVSLLAAPAAAQIDINQPLPNVLLLVDSSGSMEMMPDGTLPATCDPSQTSDLNRWGTLTEVMTGSIQGRGCWAQDRDDADFATEYILDGVDPYDRGYFLPYHRYISNGCVPTPGTYDLTDPFAWQSDGVEYRDYTTLGMACAGTWTQLSDGLMDTYRDRVRFGLFTFDSHIHPGTGVTGATTANASAGMQGLWSYFSDWNNGGTAVQGNPPNCAASDFEVGARNFAAPPWEGRMVPFPEPYATQTQTRESNSRIQEILVATRPYGATPLAGMLGDALHFFRNDTSLHPKDSSRSFGPSGDPLVQGECRENFVIVLSDGEPNLDLRPYCDTGNGDCPYDASSDYARELYDPSTADPSVKVFAIGFGLSSGTGFDCNTLDVPTDLQAGGACDGASGALAACCNLSRIAYEGGTDTAYFADDVVTLRAALANVLDQVADRTTSRTLPVFAAATATLAGSTQAPAVAYEFNSSFTPRPGELWRGTLERKRWTCETVSGVLQPVLQPVEDDKGDDFTANVNDGKLLQERTFYTVVGDTVSGAIHSQRSIRPSLSDDDGLGLYDGTTVSGNNTSVANAMQSSPAAMNLSPMPAACSSADLAASGAGDCAQKVMNWELGGTNGSLPNRVGNEFGAVYHSTPIISDAPRAFIRDAAYERFADQQANRPLMLYTATVDGQLHAFKVAANDATDTLEADALENNELWAFLPPHVLPGLISQYPSTSQILLDGRPVIRDLPFERDLAQAQASGTASGADWRTVLVAGGYLGGGFYYALDVTDPENPTFLWQLSTDDAGNSLFGNVSGTPAIATIAVADGSDVNEVAVAILPGGEGQIGAAGGCSRQGSTFPQVDSTYPVRGQVRCWQPGPSRSLTIVRLSDGEVLASFRGDAATDGPSSLDSTLVYDVDFDSPVTGTPVPYPNNSGQVANRIFVGDADGTLWRVDLASPEPSDWRVDLAFDAYPFTGDGAEDGQPIATTPVVSVDGIGNTIVLFSTGDQEDFTSTTVRGRAWSLTELPVATGTVPFTIEANWVLGDAAANSFFDPGEKVTGPIALFDGVAYFSTFTPPGSGAVCSVGTGRVWGVDFVQADTSSTGPAPEERLPDGVNLVYNQLLGDNVTPFGVAVTAEPSCTEEASITDDYVGKHTTITQSVPPTYKLRFQSGSEGDKDTGSETNVGSIALPTPRSQAIIDSWASVVE